MARLRGYDFNIGDGFVIKWGQMHFDIEVIAITPKKITFEFLRLNRRFQAKYGGRITVASPNVPQTWWKHEFRDFLDKKLVRRYIEKREDTCKTRTKTKTLKTKIQRRRVKATKS